MALYKGLAASTFGFVAERRSCRSFSLHHKPDFEIYMSNFDRSTVLYNTLKTHQDAIEAFSVFMVTLPVDDDLYPLLRVLKDNLVATFSPLFVLMLSDYLVA